MNIFQLLMKIYYFDILTTPLPKKNIRYLIQNDFPVYQDQTQLLEPLKGWQLKKKKKKSARSRKKEKGIKKASHKTIPIFNMIHVSC